MSRVSRARFNSSSGRKYFIPSSCTKPRTALPLVYKHILPASFVRSNSTHSLGLLLTTLVVVVDSPPLVYIYSALTRSDPSRSLSHVALYVTLSLLSYALVSMILVTLNRTSGSKPCSAWKSGIRTYDDPHPRFDLLHCYPPPTHGDLRGFRQPHEQSRHVSNSSKKKFFKLLMSCARRPLKTATGPG